MQYKVSVIDEMMSNAGHDYLIDVSEESTSERELTSKKLTPDTDPNLCYQIASLEYEHCIKRSERLDNKIYILLTILFKMVYLRLYRR